DEEAQNTLNAEFDKIAESLAATTLGTDAYTRANETALQALTRLSSGLVTVNTAFDTLGLSLMQSSLAGGDLASRLIDSFGSSDDFNNAVNDYWQNFYGEAERTATITRQLTGQMAALGLEMPATREGFRALVEAQDLTTESGVATLAALIKLESAFAQVTPSADDLAQAALDAAGALDEAMNSLRGSVGLTQDSIAGLFKSVLQDAKSAQEARALGEQKAGELFVSAVTDAMLGSVTSAVMSALVDPLVVQITAGAAQAAAIDVASAAQSASIDVAGAAASAETLVAGGAASATAVAAGGGVAAGSLAEGGAVAANNLAAGSGAAAQGLAAVVNQVVSTINSISAVMGTDEFRVAFQGFTSGIGAISGALYSGVGQINRAVGYVPPAQATAISGNSKSAADAATNRWQDAYDILTAAADVQRQVAQEQLNNAQAVLDMARKAAGDLRGLSDASVQQSAVGANQFIIDALATLRDSGYLPDPRQLSDAIDAARAGLNATGYASALDQQRQSLVLAGKLSQIADLSEPQVDAAQQQLDYLDDIAKTAKGQLDALQGSAKATMTLAQAIANWTGATGKNLPVPAFATRGRHDGGAFIAGEYGRELVVTGPARIWNATQTQAMLGGGWAEVAALLSTLITDHRAQARALADDRRFLRQLLGRWEHDGLPEQREMPEVLA
ncbi:MAG: hypothetical protein LBH10_01150, partial [Burkholderiaceae bacterium]|nr:hypothetical protein [Burkholderiaceae bacterium]